MKIVYSLIWLCMLTSTLCKGQPSAFIYTDSLPQQISLLDKGWKWHAGDNYDWAKPTLDDRSWESINPADDIHHLPQVRDAQVGWFRLNLRVPPSKKQLAMAVIQIGASELFLDGKLIQRYGRVSVDPGKEETLNPHGRPILIPSDGQEHILAVRYSFTRSNLYINYAGFGNPCLAVRLGRQEVLWDRFLYLSEMWDVQGVMHFSLLFILGLLHICFYLLYPTHKVNRYFGLYMILISLSCLPDPIFFHLHQTKWQYLNGLLWYLLVPAGCIFLLFAVYELLLYPKGILFKGVVGFCLLSLPLVLLFYDWGWFIASFFNYMLVSIETVRVSIRRLKIKESAARVVLTGQLIALSFFVVMGVVQGNMDVNGDLPPPLELIFRISFSGSFLPTPIFIAIRLAREFAQTSHSLEQKLTEVNRLSAQTIQQEQEKQQLLLTQNEILEQQVTERTNQLQQSLDTLKNTQNQLIQKEKMASLGELTAGIAHEIQNPLNFVNNFAEVSAELVDELKDEAQVGHTDDVLAIADDLKLNLQKITHHGKRADGIVKGMLEHSRTSSGEKQPTDLNKLADEYLKLAYQGLRAKNKDFNADLKLTLDTTLAKVDVVPQDMGRVLLNLYNNAFYATEQKLKQIPQGYQPQIWVSTQVERGKIHLRVKDNGTGIPQDILNKIYQPFFTTKPTGEGTGLGLSLTYDIVTKGHGGEICVETQTGEGTEFTLSIPV